MTPNAATPPPAHPASPRQAPAPASTDEAHAEDLDPEEDVAPNLGGEDRMQDA